MSDQEEFAALADAIARRIKEAPPRPRLRLVTPADLPAKPPPLFDDGEREWVRDRIRMWGKVYGLEQWIRQQMRGALTLEELSDEELRSLLDRVAHGVQCCQDGIGFDEAGLM